MNTIAWNHLPRLLWGALAAAGTLATCTAVWACSTPVYRYAMYNWAPEAYQVFCIHRGKPSAADEELHKLLTPSGRADDGPTANVSFTNINPDRKELIERLPPWIKKGWEARQGTSEPVYFVSTPWGEELFAGHLDGSTAAAMLDSPARQRIAQLLTEGNAAVLLVLAAPSAEKTRLAEKSIDAFLAKVGTKKSVSPADADEGDPLPRVKLARLTVSRTDPAEKWLLRNLMRCDKDPEEYRGETLVFAVFGRGRVLPPMIGEGISADNLMECLGYVSGACSCQIKDQSMGADLLMTWNWDATADQLAAAEEPTAEESASAAPAQRDPAPSATPGLARREDHDSAPAVTPVKEVLRGDRPSQQFVGMYAIGIGAAAIAVLVAGSILVIGRRS